MALGHRVSSGGTLFLVGSSGMHVRVLLGSHRWTVVRVHWRLGGMHLRVALGVGGSHISVVVGARAARARSTVWRLSSSQHAKAYGMCC